MTRSMLAVFVSLTFAGSVRAQDSADDAKKSAALEEARQHVAKAKVHYDLGEFKEAADEYIIVYRLRPIPAILFNAAQAYRQGGMYEKAKQFYKSYLRESPDAKNRAAIEESLREMDELLAKERRTKEKPPRGVKEPEETQAARVRKEPSAAPSAQKMPEGPRKSSPPPGAMAQSASAGAPAGSAGPSSPSAGGFAAAAGGAQASHGGMAAPLATLKTQALPQKSVSSTQRTVSYVLAGASVVFLAGGIGSAMKAKSYSNELLAGPHSAATTSDLIATSDSAGRLSTLLIVTGLATAAGAGVLYFVPFSSGVGVGGQF